MKNNGVVEVLEFGSFNDCASFLRLRSKSVIKSKIVYSNGDYLTTFDNVRLLRQSFGDHPCKVVKTLWDCYVVFDVA